VLRYNTKQQAQYDVVESQKMALYVSHALMLTLVLHHKQPSHLTRINNCSATCREHIQNTKRHQVQCHVALWSRQQTSSNRATQRFTTLRMRCTPLLCGFATRRLQQAQARRHIRSNA
jgi:hypothetical protein